MPMKINTRKAQITFFIIIGIVLIVIFLTVFTMISKTTEQQKGVELEESREMPIDITQLNNFAQSCVDFTIDQALLKFGKSGGILFDDVGGPIPITPLIAGEDYLYVDVEQANIAYTIKPLKGDIGPYKKDTPEYPFNGFPTMGMNYQHLMQGFYGYTKFPSLEDVTDSSNPFTIKGQLKYYVENNLKTCTKGFDNFPSFEINEGNVAAEITFHNRTTEVIVNYPLEIRKKATNDFTSIEEFTVIKPISMRDIYEFAKIILDDECLRMDNSPLDQQYGNAKVAGLMQDVTEGGFDNIIMIEDSSYLIGGKPFRLNLLAANRPPALHDIFEPDLPELNVPYTIEGDDVDLLIVKDEAGNEIYNFKDEIIGLMQTGDHKIYYDPDDDNITIEYEPELPYTITSFDQDVGKKILTIKVSDGEYADWQTITFGIVS